MWLVDFGRRGHRSLREQVDCSVSATGTSAERLRALVGGLLALVLLTLIVGLPAVGDWCGLSPDSFAYLGTARTIWEEGTFGDGRLVHPPGYSLLLSLLMVFGEAPFAAIRLLSLGCWTAAAVLTWILMRPLLGERPAWLTAALVATSPLLLTQSAMLLSELAYLPVMLGCLVVASRWQLRREVSRWEAILGGLLAAAAMLIRSMGVVLAPVMVWGMLVQRNQPARRRAAAAMLFAAAFILPNAMWQLRQSAQPAGYGYGTIWTTAREVEATDATGAALQMERLAKFGPQRPADLRAAIVPNQLGWRAFEGVTGDVTTWIVGGGVVVLLLIRAFRYRSVVEISALLTLAMLALWPWDEGPRLVAPLLPIVFAGIVWAACGVYARSRAIRGGRAVVAAAILVLLVAQSAEVNLTHGSLNRLRARTTARLSEMRDVAAWQTEHMPEGAEYLAVTAAGDNAKVTLMGAGYFARRSMVGAVECGKRRPTPTVHDRAAYVFVHDATARECFDSAGAMVVGHVGAFTVYRR